MNISNHPQGTPEWHLARAGVITASMFKFVRTKVGCLDERQTTYVEELLRGTPEITARKIAGYQKEPSAAGIEVALKLKTTKIGMWSAAAENYAFRLACERIAKAPLSDQIETYAMRRGKELEEECRILHEIHLGDVVETAGFISTDDNKFGCSADALVLPDGGGEYKCFYDPAMVRPIILDGNWGEIMDQVQGCLWLTGFKWWDMCLYVPGLKEANKHFTVKRVMRDERYIEDLEQDLVEFERMVTTFESRLRA